MKNGNKIIYIRSKNGYELRVKDMVPGDTVVAYRWDGFGFAGIYNGFHADDIDEDPEGTLELIPTSKYSPIAIRGRAIHIVGRLFYFQLYDDVENFRILSSAKNESMSARDKRLMEFFINGIEYVQL